MVGRWRHNNNDNDDDDDDDDDDGDDIIILRMLFNLLKPSGNFTYHQV
jgi:hypothetical protein